MLEFATNRTIGATFFFLFKVNLCSQYWDRKEKSKEGFYLRMFYANKNRFYTEVSSVQMYYTQGKALSRNGFSAHPLRIVPM
ncbi:MAG: hypothetical protein RID53_13410 [Coleofasciculus sp. B1-GNL1-01]|uniref:hypothetical protein n=1 Tax=Coleofasciculus sp. B1-GNL1-01 TaxID=3068484 RepID=UPI0032FACDA2